MLKKKLISSLLLCFQLIFVDFCFAQNFEQIFEDDYINAQNFISQNDITMQLVCNYFANDALLVESIVFPELIRYNLLKDFFEIVSLKIIYVQHGSEAVDFSVGDFQMKPSFVENLENEVVKLKLSQYYFINKFKSNQIEKLRAERVDRLTNLYWQIIYVNCFVSILNVKYKTKVFKTAEDKSRFYASAYNVGINAKESQIVNNFKNTFFPYGKHYKGIQYSYCDVSLYFYKKTKNSIN